MVILILSNSLEFSVIFLAGGQLLKSIAFNVATRKRTTIPDDSPEMGDMHIHHPQPDFHS